MKVLGVVQWINRDKHNHLIAGVRPLLEIQNGEWRPITAATEFPSQGQAFWWNAQTAVEDALITFRAEPNPGQKDEWKVVDAKLAHEVLDLRTYGTTVQVRAALAVGVRLGGPVGVVRALVWCMPDDVVGPVELHRADSGIVKLNGTNLHRLAVSSGAQVRSVAVDHLERLVRVDDSAPSAYVDWDDNAVVLRRALEAAVRIAKETGDPGQTKRQIEDAARALASRGIGPDAQLDRYRVERAFALVESTDILTRRAAELTDLLQDHPAIKATLEELSAKVRAHVELSARADLDNQLASEKAALRETTEALVRAKSQLEASQNDVHRAEERITELSDRAESTASAAEAAVHARVLAAIDRPLDLLAEVSVLRPLLRAGGNADGSVHTVDAAKRDDWVRTRGQKIDDKASLRRILTSVARSLGVDPSLMLQVHAAITVGIMPLTLGPRALAALTAYAKGVCGGRLLVIHVSPSTIQVRDLEDAPDGGLRTAAEAAKGVDGVSLLIMEGINRAAIEGSVLPLLQMIELGLSPLYSTSTLRLAATVVAGATTVPITPQIWSYAAAIYSGTSCAPPQTFTAGDIPLTSELFSTGEEPKDVIDALIDAWPDCSELRPIMSRYGSALTCLYDQSRVAEVLLHSVVLPYVATALSPEEQIEALNSARDSDESLTAALRRLRTNLC
jgi:hypothetical protein